jgi:RHS repeat-associated protein
MKAKRQEYYTGPELTGDFGLINMNGRLYDPVLGRFLNADPVIQLPGFTQSYNSYSYVMNNPLRFTDPTGYTASTDVFIV